MLNVGGWELLIILLVGLIFLGPTRLPEVARQVGQTVSSLRELARGFQTELENAARPDPLTAPAPAMSSEADPGSDIPADPFAGSTSESRTMTAESTDTAADSGAAAEPSIAADAAADADGVAGPDPADLAARAREVDVAADAAAADAADRSTMFAGDAAAELDADDSDPRLDPET